MQKQQIQRGGVSPHKIPDTAVSGGQNAARVRSSTDLETCLSRADLWRGNHYFFRDYGQQDKKISATGTGYPVLDALLPGRGWSAADLTEINVPDWGQGEMRLLMPALSSLAQQGQKVALVSPPMVPYAPAIAASGIALEQIICIQAGQNRDVLWSMEKLLRCADVGAVLCWAKPGFQQARRLQMAAQSGGTLGFVLNRNGAGSVRASLPVGVRLHARANSSGLAVKFIKLRNQCDAVSVQLNWH